MTRGDFILSVISSLLATILFELAKKFYPQLKIKSVETGKQFLIIITNGYLVVSDGFVLAFSFARTICRNIKTVVLSPDFQGVVAGLVLMFLQIYFGISKPGVSRMIKQHNSEISSTVREVVRNFVF